ncbi:flagellar hook-length control protein FliK [Alkalicoccobacillus plakortidis]|uniref:Flagellar hook-length control protein FliK n=1 Tax=Alkalicoccobacillus plakortidis TaxID=444060 RepID=A0ABT0XFR0_9BACI|nr:flagellar hook-length control protein FliK [Alkalicoccobacillus plakortidis]MCM2674736.1 flagellar hook-length control protein FliK [Alkalicoccobacillus plakortidis]
MGLERKFLEGLQTDVSRESDSMERVPAFAEFLQRMQSPERQESNAAVTLQRRASTSESVADENPELELQDIEDVMKPLLMYDADSIAEFLDVEALTTLLLPLVTQPSISEQQTQQTLDEGRQSPEMETGRTPSPDQIRSVVKQVIPLHLLPTFTSQQSNLAQNQEQEDLEMTLPTKSLEGIESFKKAEQLSKVLMSQNTQFLETEEFTFVSKQVESFLTGEGKATLGLLLKDLKQTFKAMENVFSNPTAELETSDKLEKLLQQFKPVEQKLKSMDQDPQSQMTRQSSLLSEEVTSHKDSQIDVAPSRTSLKSKVPEVNNSTAGVITPNSANETEPLISVERSVPSMQMTSTKESQQPVESESLQRSEEQRFVKQLQRIFQQGTMTQLKDGQVQFTLKLFPEHLGKLQIQLIQTGQKLTAQIVAESSATKDLVERSLPQLRQALATNNIPLEHIDVEESMLQDQQQRGDEGSDQHQSKQDEKEDTANTVSFSFKTLLEGLFST